MAQCMTHTPTTSYKHLPPLQKQMTAIILKHIGWSPTVLDSINWLNMTLLYTTPTHLFQYCQVYGVQQVSNHHVFLFTSFSTEMHVIQCSYGISFCSYDADFSIRHLNSFLKTLFTELSIIPPSSRSHHNRMIHLNSHRLTLPWQLCMKTFDLPWSMHPLKMYLWFRYMYVSRRFYSSCILCFFSSCHMRLRHYPLSHVSHVYGDVIGWNMWMIYVAVYSSDKHFHYCNVDACWLKEI